jgi:hypothetical protein
MTTRLGWCLAINVPSAQPRSEWSVPMTAGSLLWRSPRPHRIGSG